MNLERSGPNVTWGFRLQGGKDRGLPFQLLKVRYNPPIIEKTYARSSTVYSLSFRLFEVPLNSVAGEAGCRSNDYLVKIQGQDVFNMGHDKAKSLIRDAGNSLSLVIERYARTCFGLLNACSLRTQLPYHGSLSASKQARELSSLTVQDRSAFERNFTINLGRAQPRLHHHFRTRVTLFH